MNPAEAMKSNRNAGHAHIWLRDDRDGYRAYVCVCCALVFEIKEEP